MPIQSDIYKDISAKIQPIKPNIITHYPGKTHHSSAPAAGDP